MPRRHRLMVIVCAHVGRGLFWEHTGVKMQRLFGHLEYSVEDLWPAHWFSHRGALKKYWLLKYLGESPLSLFVLIFARYNTENSTFLPHSVVCKDKETYAAQFCVLHDQRLIWRVNHSKPIFHPKHPLSKEKMSYIHFTSACAWRKTGLVDGDTSLWSIQISSPWEWGRWK